jgi:hypothetical protein
MDYCISSFLAEPDHWQQNEDGKKRSRKRRLIEILIQVLSTN